MNGSYVSSASSFETSGTNYAYKVFDGVVGDNGHIWHCAYGGNGYNQDPYTSGTYQGGGTGSYWSTVVSGQTYNGEWLQIKFPYAFVLTSYKIYLRTAATSWNWKSFVLAGSTDGTTWTSLDSRTYTSTFPSTGDTFTVTSPTVNYSYYRFIITTVVGGTGNVAHCGELNLFGTY